MGMYKDLTTENWLEEDRIFDSLRAIGGNFDPDRWAKSVLGLRFEVGYRDHADSRRVSHHVAFV
jgi:hypothetical protein